MQRRDEEMEAKAEELKILKEEVRRTENFMSEKKAVFRKRTRKQSRKRKK